MCAAIGVCLYKHTACTICYEKVLRSNPNISLLNPENASQSPSALSQLSCAFNCKLNLTDKRLLSLRTPMVKSRQIRRCQGFKKHGRHVMAMSKTP